MQLGLHFVRDADTNSPPFQVSSVDIHCEAPVTAPSPEPVLLEGGLAIKIA